MLASAKAMRLYQVPCVPQASLRERQRVRIITKTLDFCNVSSHIKGYGKPTPALDTRKKRTQKKIKPNAGLEPAIFGLLNVEYFLIV